MGVLVVGDAPVGTSEGETVVGAGVVGTLVGEVVEGADVLVVPLFTRRSNASVTASNALIRPYPVSKSNPCSFDISNAVDSMMS